MVNICHKMFKMSYQVFLSIKFQFHRLSVRAVSFSFVDVTTTPIYKYTTLATKHATVRKFVLSSRINISSAPVVVIFSSYLTSLWCKMTSPIPLSPNVTATSSLFLIKNVYHVHQQSLLAQRNSASCN